MKKIIKHYPMTDRLIVRRGYILYMTFICIYHPSLWNLTCFGGASCLIVYAPESHTLINYRVRLVSGGGGGGEEEECQERL